MRLSKQLPRNMRVVCIQYVYYGRNNIWVGIPNKMVIFGPFSLCYFYFWYWSQ